MRKMILVGAVVVSAFTGFSSGALADTKSADQGKACQAVFDKNRTTIESMAGAKNTAGIQGIFSANGCPGALVNLANAPVSLAKQQQAKVKCTFKLIPPTITCTFGVAAIPVGPRSY